MARKDRVAAETEHDIFAERLRTIMRLRGESQTSLAARIKEGHERGIYALSITRQAISLYTQGQSTPKTESLTVLCDALDVSADYLLGRQDDPTNDPNMKTMVEYTGLSSTALENIRDYDEHRKIFKLPFNSLDVLFSGDSQIEWNQRRDILDCVAYYLIYSSFDKLAEIETGEEANKLIIKLSRKGYRFLSLYEYAEFCRYHAVSGFESVLTYLRARENAEYLTDEEKEEILFSAPITSDKDVMKKFREEFEKSFGAVGNMNSESHQTSKRRVEDGIDSEKDQ